MENAMGRDFFGMIAEYFINERLGDILMQDERYVKLQDEIWERMKELETFSMDSSQCIAVKELISLYIKSIDFYAEKAYEYGFRDCISVLEKFGLIKVL